MIVDMDMVFKVYFINGNKYDLYVEFVVVIGVDYLSVCVQVGQVIYYFIIIVNSGILGIFVFNYSNGYGWDFEIVQKIYEFLVINMLFLKNNLFYFIMEFSEDEYERDQQWYEVFCIFIFLEVDVYVEIDYWGLYQVEGFGFF